MAVYKRKTCKGETSEYHYKFMQYGKYYYGVCEGCTEEKKALAYEKTVKNSAKKLSEQKNIKALVENFRDELTGGGQIKLADAYELSLKKPKKRQPGEERIKFKRAYWDDFKAYMAANYPDVITLANVRRKHAEEYIQYLREKGRFNNEIKSGTKKAYKAATKLSSSTINVYHQTFMEIFELLEEDAGIVENPFLKIPKLKNESEEREAFTEAELRLIRDNLDSFVKPLFIIAIATALREGDICTLKWREINFDLSIIKRKKMRKTGHGVEIPIMPPLKTYLLEMKQLADTEEDNAGNVPDNYALTTKAGEIYKGYSLLSATDKTIKISESSGVMDIAISDLTEESKIGIQPIIDELKHKKTYVLPLHAKMYLGNRAGVSYRVKSFLERIGIATTIKPEGRSRSVSIKDLHSCRHTFCYYAGMYGIPLAVVQSIVGHMSEEMTKHYSAHATREAKRTKMELLPDFMGMTVTPVKQIAPPEPEREELRQLVETLPIEVIKEFLKFAQKTK
ncbi:MAG: tyrosine-type recombinase/integrase [Lentisphaerota bacterium]